MPRPVKISVIGAGSAVFSLGIVKDVCLTPNLHGSEVSFMDINPERLDTVYSVAHRYSEELGANVRFEKAADRQASMRDADFVINTAFPLGHHHARRLRDLTAKHGYHYGGVGIGSFYDFELMLAVAHDIERICPDAWLIQSGNPVFDGCTLMTRETGVKIIGLCHGHYGYLEICRVLGLDPSRVTWEAPGLNHCIWLNHFLYEGKDAYPLLDEWIATKGEAYWRDHIAKSTHDIQMSRGSIHQYRLYGKMPIGDTPRHAVTNWWYHDDLAAKKRWFGEPFGGPDTEIARPKYVADQEKKMRQIAEVAANPKADVSAHLGTTKTREQQIPIIDALTNNVEGRFQVNVPNRGTIAGIPDDVVVESQAIIDASGVHQLKPTPLPRKIMLEQVLPRWLEMERNVEAYQSRDLSMLFWNGLTGHKTHSYEQAVEAFQDVLNMPEHAELRA
ncbi:MAG: alpha-glucosidase AglA, partial [Chloroflexota bacterium]